MIEFLDWLVHLLEFLAHRASLHVTVGRVQAYDTRNKDYFYFPMAGWEAEVEISNRGSRRTTVTDVRLVIEGDELAVTEDRKANFVFDPGDARQFLFTFSQDDLKIHADRYELRMRDAYGKRMVKRGQPSPPSPQ